MPNEKTWQEKYNIQMSNTSLQIQQRNIVWSIKAFMKGDAGISGAPSQGLWTCYYSCDSATAGAANDGVDRWGTTFDSTKVVRAAAGVAHSWMVLKSPTNYGGITGNGPYYLIIDYASANDYSMDLILSKAAPTGGSTTARPTATDEWTVSSDVQFHDNTGGGTWKVHGLLSTDSLCWMFASKDNGGTAHWGFSTQALAETSSADLYNCFGYSKETNPFDTSGMQSTAFKGREYDGSTTVDLKPLNFSNGSENPINAMVFRRSDYKLLDLPIYMYTGTAGHRDLRGRIYDIRWGPGGAGVEEGTVVPNNVSPTYTLINDLWFPCSTVPSL